MQQIRLYLTTSKIQAELIYAFFDKFYENKDYAISMIEVDEKTDEYEVSLYAPVSEINSILENYSKYAPDNSPALSQEKLPSIDWVAHSLANLKPIETDKFFIHGSHNRHLVNSSKIAIEIDANQAFGTGHHETTRGCLITIAKYYDKIPPMKALDLGTGSGILAIALAKLGCYSVLASDCDSTALAIATQNCYLNNVNSQIETIVSDGFSHNRIKENSSYDLIVANILADPLIKLAHEIATHISPRGRLILSGILTTQKNSVCQAYAKTNLIFQEHLSLGDWSILSFTAP